MKTKASKKKIKRKIRHFKSVFSFIVSMMILVFGILYFFRLPIYKSLLNKNSIEVTAKIINDRNVISQSAIDPEYTYSYEFYVNGIPYFGDSRILDYKIGDTIQVEYWPTWPTVNMSKKYKKRRFESNN
jgi:hypothetical protein